MFYVHTLAFNDLAVVEGAVENYLHTRGVHPHKYLVVDCNYPLVEDAPRIEKLKSLALKAGAEYVRLPEDIEGVAQSWTWVWQHVDGGEQDILFGFDPDVRMQTQHWIEAVNEAFEREPSAGVICMNRMGFAEYRSYSEIRQAGDVELLAFNHLVAWSCGAYHGRFLKAVGNVIRQDNALYGYIEHWSARELARVGMRWFLLRDFYDEHLQREVNPVYAMWKNASAHKRTTESFRNWLRMKGVT